jgi:hypothetical protein
MTDDELNAELATLIPPPPRQYRQCRVMLARQAALREAGPDHQAYFRQWRARLIEDAGELIKRSPKWVKYHADY